MPEAALRIAQPDYVLPPSQIAADLTRLASDRTMRIEGE